MGFPFPTDITQFLAWLGTSAAGGVIVSLLLERIPAFRDWKSEWKGRVIMALFVALPVVSAALLPLVQSIDPAVLAEVQKWLGLALGGLVAWGASQYAHDADPGRESNYTVTVPLVGEIDSATGRVNFGDAATGGKDEITNGRVTL